MPPDWVARNIAALAQGVDAVAGRIALDETDAARVPEALHARGRLEGAYEALLSSWRRLSTLSRTTRGRATGRRRVRRSRCGSRPIARPGVCPPLAVGEDRAFVSSLLTSDALVRHDPDILVVTSGRLDGRAPGGGRRHNEAAV